MSVDIPNFHFPITDDDDSTWGPPKNSSSSLDDEIPYAPFSKNDLLGKAADWTVEDRKDFNRGARRDKFNRGGETSTTTLFSYQHGEDESSFSLVDASGKAAAAASVVVSGAKRGGRGGFQRGGGRGGFQRGGMSSRGSGFQRFGKNTTRRYGGRGGYGGRNNVTRESSVSIGVEWKIVQEIDMSKLSKVKTNLPEVEDLSSYGSVYHYNKTYDRVNTRAEKPLIQSERQKIYHITSSMDPILEKYSKEIPDVKVFATDAIMALLMACPRSFYSWDIVVNRVDDKIFLDKRDGSSFDYLTVNENAHEPPADATDKDNNNSQSSLSMETTYINSNFFQQILDFDDSLALKNHEYPTEFGADSNSVPIGYRYRKWKFDDDLVIVARTEVDAALKTNSEQTSFVNARAVNEFDPRAPGSGGSLDWRTKLDSQRGAILATEMKNNGFKLARWALQSILAGADTLKLGYVTRNHFKDNNKHTVLGIQNMKPADIASQMNLGMNNAWGIFRALINECSKLDEGRYIFVKDPNKAVIRLYSVPPGTFDNEEDDQSVGDTASTVQAGK